MAARFVSMNEGRNSDSDGQETGAKESRRLVRRGSTSTDSQKTKSSQTSGDLIKSLFYIAALVATLLLLAIIIMAVEWPGPSSPTQEIIVVNSNGSTTVFLSNANLPIDAIFNSFFLQYGENITIWNVSNGTNTTTNIILEVLSAEMSYNENGITVTTTENITLEIFRNGTVLFDSVLYTLQASENARFHMRKLLTTNDPLSLLNISFTTSCPLTSLPHLEDVGQLNLNFSQESYLLTAYCNATKCSKSCRIPTQLNVSRCDNTSVTSTLATFLPNTTNFTALEDSLCPNQQEPFLCDLEPYPTLRACSLFCPSQCTPWVLINGTWTTYTDAQVVFIGQNMTFLLDGSTPLDVNELTVFYRCVPYDTHATCVIQNGGVSCSCIQGWQLSDSTDHSFDTTCVDINECDASPCITNMICHNTLGSYVCECSNLTGLHVSDFETGASSCVFIDACSLRNPCTSPAKCVTTNGTSSCVCPTGYSLSTNHSACNDINECNQTNQCSASATCRNTPGSYNCTCNATFVGDGTVCIQTCPIGYNLSYSINGESGTCVDINECLYTNYTLCRYLGQFSFCTNLPGSFQCGCNDGYYGVPCVLNCSTGYTPSPNQTTCVDVNECNEIPSPCDPYATCSNTVGSFTCQCNSSYVGNGFHCGLFCNLGYQLVNPNNATCVDINECNLTSPPCDINTTNCNNTQGSYVCLCKAGFLPDPNNPVPQINHCVINCSTGFQPTNDGTQCSDINECLAIPRPCDPHANCTNTNGSFTCVCNNGYNGNGASCAIQCNAGYQISSTNDSACVDVNECVVYPRACDLNANCTNTNGNYTCSCNTGYSGNGFSCAKPCAYGYQLSTLDDTVCVDINECNMTNRCSSFSTCGNTNGSYTCTCNGGFVGDGYTCSISTCASGYQSNPSNTSQCIDINECLLTPRACDPNAACINLIGSYNCTCNHGFAGNGSSCAIKCSPGYTLSALDDTLCVDINECDPLLNLTLFCSSHAVCNNTPGKYQCLCNAGFVGDGCTCDTILCDAGYYDPILFGVNICSPCPIATYQPDSDAAATACLACDAGYTTEGDASNSSGDCSVIIDNCAVLGPNATCQAHSHCVSVIGHLTYNCPCDANHVLNNDSLCVYTQECDLTTSHCTPDVEACIEFTNSGSVYDPLSYYPSSYPFNPDATLCVCGPGYASTDGNASDCGLCAPGFFSNVTTMVRVSYDNTTTYCVECGAGKYQGGPGQTLCNDCNACYHSGVGASICIQNDQCTIGNNCSSHAVCANNASVGSCYTCSCNSGYYGSGQICTVCPTGFMAVNVTSNISDCNIATHYCDTIGCGSNTNCVEHINYTAFTDTFTCTCDGGYSGDPYGSGCDDIDECSSDHGGCDGNADCINTPGSFECSCDSGYSGNGFTCTDINECITGNFSILYVWNSSILGGFPGNGSIAVTIPTFSPDATPSMYASLFDMAGNDWTAGFNAIRNSLPDGGLIRFRPFDTTYHGDPLVEGNLFNSSVFATYARDVIIIQAGDISHFTGGELVWMDWYPTDNPDAASDCVYGAYCINTIGSYDCICNVPADFYGSDGRLQCFVGQTCSDVEPCVNTNSTCTLFDSNSICLCDAGYGGDGITCTQCTVGFFSSGVNDTLCESCGDGYTSSNPFTGCTDIDECLTPDECNVVATCTNLPGSFECTCNTGYSGDGFSCIPILMKMFITNNSYAPTFGSVEAADTVCQAEATTFGLNVEAEQSQTYRAFISNSSMHPASAWTGFTSSPGNGYKFVMFQGTGLTGLTIFATNFSELLADRFYGQGTVGVSTAFNKSAGHVSLGSATFLWTATFPNGTYGGLAGPGSDCVGWTSASSSDFAFCGWNGAQINGVPGYWTDSRVLSSQTQCSVRHHLYCIQQPIILG